MKMSNHDDIVETWSYFVNQLATLHSTMSYIHCIEPRIAGIADQDVADGESLEFLHKIWSPRPILVAGAYNAERAYAAAEAKPNVIVMFGRYFISNVSRLPSSSKEFLSPTTSSASFLLHVLTHPFPQPDLISRIRNNVALTPYNRDTFYLYGPENTQGYNDYPVSTEIAATA
jgi:NADPH2 dehydrogenase